MAGDIDKYNLKADDVGRIWNVGKVRQLLFEPIQNKHRKRAYDSVRSHSLPISERWDGQTGSQYEEERKAVNERRGKYRLGIKEKIDQSECVGQKDGLYEVNSNFMKKNMKLSKIELSKENILSDVFSLPLLKNWISCSKNVS